MRFFAFSPHQNKTPHTNPLFLLILSSSSSLIHFSIHIYYKLHTTLYLIKPSSMCCIFLYYYILFLFLRLIKTKSNKYPTFHSIKLNIFQVNIYILYSTHTSPILFSNSQLGKKIISK